MSVRRDPLRKLRKSANQLIVIVSRNGLPTLKSMPYACEMGDAYDFMLYALPRTQVMMVSIYAKKSEIRCGGSLPSYYRQGY